VRRRRSFGKWLLVIVETCEVDVKEIGGAPIKEAQHQKKDNHLEQCWFVAIVINPKMQKRSKHEVDQSHGKQPNERSRRTQRSIQKPKYSNKGSGTKMLHNPLLTCAYILYGDPRTLEYTYRP